MSKLGDLLGMSLKSVLGVGEKFTEHVIAPAAKPITKGLSVASKAGEKVIQEGGKFLAEQPGVFGYSPAFAEKFGVKEEDRGGYKQKRWVDLNQKKFTKQKLTEEEEKELTALNSRNVLRFGFMSGGLQEVNLAKRIFQQAATQNYTPEMVKQIVANSGGKLPQNFIQGRIDDVSLQVARITHPELLNKGTSATLESIPATAEMKKALLPLLKKSYTTLGQFIDDVLAILINTKLSI